MALDLGDVGEFFDPDMKFTLHGKEYRIPPVSAELGLWGRNVAALGFSLAASATPEERAALLEQAQIKVGPAPVPEGQTQDEALLSPGLLAELVADGVDDPTVQHLAGVAFARLIGGDKMALAAFRGEIGPNLQSPAPNRATRRAAAKATKKAAPKASGSRTTSTGAAATTRRVDSGNGTKSPTKNAAKKAASRGGKS